MADPNDSQTPGNGEQAPAAGGDTPEIIDAEVVDSSQSRSREPGGVTLSSEETEQFRQYQQFLKFQEWQRQQAGQSPPTPSGPRPWWNRLLALLWTTVFRRVVSLLLTVALTLLVLAIAAFWLINHFFGDHTSQQSSGQAVPGNQNAAISPVQGSDPRDAVGAVYKYLAYSQAAAQACDGLTAQGKAQFAAANAGSDCVTAADALSRQVTDVNAYVNVKIADNAVTIANGQATVAACGVQVTGGPHLGTFHLQQLPNGGWVIDGYQSPPANCPTPTASPAPPS